MKLPSRVQHNLFGPTSISQLLGSFSLLSSILSNNNMYLKSNIYNMVSTLRLYNAYKEFSEIGSTQLCNNTLNCIVFTLWHDLV